MALSNRAILEIDIEDDSVTGVFEFEEGLQTTSDVQKNYLLSNRGQYLREAVDIGTDLLPNEVANADLEDRKGYHVDGGAGSYQETLSFTAAQGDQWGDGSTDPSNPDDVAKTDASGAGLTPMKQVLVWYLTQGRTDSRGGCRLHIGEWTDGTYTGTAGAFGQPLPMAILEASITNDPDDPSALDVTLTCEWTAVFPDVDLRGAIEDGLDELADLIPDF